MNLSAQLSKVTGKFRGTGTNHSKENFVGTFELNEVVQGKGFRLKFVAAGSDGTVFHEEESMIAPSLEEKWTLWNLNSNMPGLVAHELKTAEQVNEGIRLEFAFGSVANRDSFREVISLTLRTDGTIHYLYSWGIPGGDFAERSGVTMSRLNS